MQNPMRGRGFRDRRPGRQSADQCGCSDQAHKLVYSILSILVHLKFSIKKKKDLCKWLFKQKEELKVTG